MKKTILIEGPFLSQSGYGHQARFALDALLHDDRFDIHLINVGWGKSSTIDKSSKYHKIVSELSHKTYLLSKKAAETQIQHYFDVFLHIGILNEMQNRTAAHSYSYTAGVETTRVSSDWLVKLNSINGMIVPSSFSKSIFEMTKYKTSDADGNQHPDLVAGTPIHVVNFNKSEIESSDFHFDFDFDFNFLAVAQWAPRKNLELLVDAFLQEFKDDEVGLVLKTNLYNNSYMDRKYTEVRIRHFLTEYTNRKCKVYLLHGSVPDEEIQGLYRHDKIKCMASSTHGEGFGLPLFDAACAGLPVVTTGWSGELDFLAHQGEKYFTPVEFSMQPVQKEAVYEKVIEDGSMWAYADLVDMRKKMRYVYENLDEVEQKARILKEIHLDVNFKKEDKYKEFVDVLYEKYSLTDEEVMNWINNMEIIE